MDYTTLASVKRALGSNENADDVLLAELITQASRTIDRCCAGPDNYFARETLTDVIVNGFVSARGVLLCHLPKPVVAEVELFAYRDDMEWKPVDGLRIVISGYSISARVPLGPGRVQVKVSFTGGFDPLPDDLVNAATLLSVRFYREIKSGLGDAIGVAELGTLTYTKAFPVRLVEMLKPYRRLL